MMTYVMNRPLMTRPAYDKRASAGNPRTSGSSRTMVKTLLASPGTAPCGISLGPQVFATLVPMENDRQGSRRGVLDVNGADCPSCAFTIERIGRRLPGVSEVRVDTARHEIRVDYDGAPGTLERIAGIVGRLGYIATVRRT